MSDYTTLQQKIRSDPEGYRSDFLLQLRHYQASLEIFKTRPNEPSKEFATLVRFMASVAGEFPNDTRSFVADLIQLLDKNHEILDRSLRKALVQSLMQLRQRRQVELMELLPLFFRLFSCQDKALRLMLFAFIVADIKTSNRTGQGHHQLNRQMKGFLLNTLKDSNEMIAKKALAILTDLWRRQIWHDVHTANVIASAVEHPNNTVMYAAVKFFLGYDLKECEDDDEEEDRINKESQISSEDIYKAQKKGTRVSKKKKINKLKRVKAALVRQARRSSQPLTEQFAAIQLLQDPYKLSETLFARARSGKVTAQTRLAIIQLLSRVISVHRLVLLNFYPYLQKYLNPSGRDVVTVLGALVEGCHDLVPPDALEAVMKQLVDRFVHDHARPEVITIGLKTVREMCARAPLMMNETLLSDLVLYAKFKDTEVRASAKGLISLFREIAPHMLPKKERGRWNPIPGTEPLEFGKTHVYDRLEGAELLQREKETDTVDHSSQMESDGEEAGSDSEDGAEEVPQNPNPDSLRSLKKELALLRQKQSNSEEIALEEELKSSDDAQDASSEEDLESVSEQASDPPSLLDMEGASAGEQQTAELPIEMTEILGDEDFQRLQELKREEATKHQLMKFGIAPGAEKSQRLIDAAEADADDLIRRQEGRTHLSETGLDPTDLLGKKRGKANKTERMLSVLRGREEQEPYESKASNKKKKTGGLSNKEKIKRKNLPLKGRMAQAKKRRKTNAIKRKAKNFKGHVRKR